MRSKNGFTLIELLITITIMAILLTLTVVSLRSSQAVARDEERKADVAAIAHALENYFNGDVDQEASVEYASASPTASLASFSFKPSVKLAAGGGSYPLYQEDNYPPTAYFTNEAAIQSALISLDMAAIRAPGVAESAAPSLVGATSTSAQSPSTSTYIYQPLAKDGTLCDLGATSAHNTEQCREFTLYYQLETVSGVQTITSKHR